MFLVLIANVQCIGVEAAVSELRQNPDIKVKDQDPDQD